MQTLRQHEILTDLSSEALRTVTAAMEYNTGFNSGSVKDK